MFGVRLSSLFTSRWMALLWAVLVILTAIQFVGASDDRGVNAAQTGQGATDPADNAITDQQKAAINSVF
ncbi:hypothetical protein [Sphingobium sp. EM0848]|uniref:hypothetical protein n=1 Tax=Sphingobium sp. EM0848 TaxID=2743473 RepID=UPI00159C54CF|nr:hypothetical protein [Sphingobium sp. EM0848]